MSSTPDDFDSFLHQLEEHPQWRAQLRRVVLSEELLELPGSFKELIQAQVRTESNLGVLAERMDQLTQRVDLLAERMGQLTQRVDLLTERMDQLTQRVDLLTERMDQLTQRVDLLAERMGQLTRRVDAMAAKIDQLVAVVSKLTGEQPGIKGFITEARYEKKAHAYFAPIARRLRVLGPPDLDKILDVAEASGALSEDEADDIRLADIVARGKRKQDGEEVFLVVEAAWVVDKYDVQRARHRAGLLAKAGVQTIGVVAGEAIEDEAQVLARDWELWQVTNGTVVSPQAGAA